MAKRCHPRNSSPTSHTFNAGDEKSPSKLDATRFAPQVPRNEENLVVQGAANAFKVCPGRWDVACPVLTTKMERRIVATFATRSKKLLYILGTKGIATRSKDATNRAPGIATNGAFLLLVTRTLLGAPGIATRSKDATRGSWP